MANRKDVARASLLATLGVAAMAPVGFALATRNDDGAPIGAASTPGERQVPATEELPFEEIEQRALDAFFGAGYDVAHAETLAEYWGWPSAYDAKVTKGKVLLGLIDFPPAADDAEFGTVQDRAFDAYFNAGYDYDHAVVLAEYWGFDDPADAKLIKGKFLLGLIDFPEPADNVDMATIEEQAYDAYFEAGYDYDHAVDLAEFWGFEDPADAKFIKGKVLLGLIDFPPPADVHGDDIDDGDQGEDGDGQLSITDQALNAYVEAGFTYDDAVWLADLWGYETAYEAKISKGKYLLGLIEYPEIVNEPGEGNENDNPPVDDNRPIEEQALDAYFEFYDYDHAVWLADYWGYDSVYDAKVTKGKFMLGLIDFPDPAVPEEAFPGDDGRPIADQALDAFFGNGYDYDHAVALADYWGYETAYEAKLIKGKFLLGLIDFPAPVA
ncbi:MAG: hypothetical protein AAF467_15385 [Actinomycetota bacterium]